MRAGAFILALLVFLIEPTRAGELVAPSCCGRTFVVTGDVRFADAAPDAKFEGVEKPERFQREAYGPYLTATLPDLPKGQYRVEIELAETYHHKPGERLMDVKIGSRTVAEDLDILKAAGGFAKVHTIRETVSHYGGNLDITFQSVKDNAKFNFIHVFDENGKPVGCVTAGELRYPALEEASRLPEVSEPVVYTDPTKPIDARVADLVRRMSLAEKVGQMVNSAKAVDRLGVPAYDYWNECLHGVARAGHATVFPQAIALAATWDPDLIRQIGDVISTEARAKYNEDVRLKRSPIRNGLTFWSPNINLFRDPRWGRGHETYGEDPFLTGTIGVAFIKGLQGDDPRYRKLVATAKHYAVHSGPELLRHTFDAVTLERDFYESYLPHFEMAVREARVESIMGAYNAVYGLPACASPLLLDEILHKRWGFDGFVVSDCGAIYDIWRHHRTVDKQEQAAAIAVKAGCDLECGVDYVSLIDAVYKKLLTTDYIDRALSRILRARFRLGMFDPPAQVPWSGITLSQNDSPEHHALSLKAAHESIVLLKNDGVLPLDKLLKRIAVVGPNADSLPALLGNYNGTPSVATTVLEGIRQVAKDSEVVSVHGCDYAPRTTTLSPVPEECLRAGGAPGLRGEYFNNRDLLGEPVVTRQDPIVEFAFYFNSHVVGWARAEISARWSGEFVAPEDGEYTLAIESDDDYRLWVDGRPAIDEWKKTSGRMPAIQMTLRAGQSVPIRLEYGHGSGWARCRLVWDRADIDMIPRVVERVRDCDAIIFVGGLCGDIEDEETLGTRPLEGFRGGDRTKIELPTTQTLLLQALHATGKPVVFVNLSGSAVAMPWEAANLRAIVQGWYPGQFGGRAIADVLFGEVNPSGRLPITFYRSTDELPTFTDYGMAGRTYRFLHGRPLWAFGHGLSYTKFDYSGMKVDSGESIRASVTIRNSGHREGDEVVQLYARALDAPVSMPVHSLRAFQRVSLKPGESQEIELSFKREDLRIWDTAAKDYRVLSGTYELQVGASSADLRLRETITIP